MIRIIDFRKSMVVLANTRINSIHILLSRPDNLFGIRKKQKHNNNNNNINGECFLLLVMNNNINIDINIRSSTCAPKRSSSCYRKPPNSSCCVIVWTNMMMRLIIETTTTIGCWNDDTSIIHLSICYPFPIICSKNNYNYYQFVLCFNRKAIQYTDGSLQQNP